jgi:hypothetical protein
MDQRQVIFDGRKLLRLLGIFIHGAGHFRLVEQEKMRKLSDVITRALPPELAIWVGDVFLDSVYTFAFMKR